jgi:hypothetical protein
LDGSAFVVNDAFAQWGALPMDWVDNLNGWKIFYLDKPTRRRPLGGLIECLGE